MDRGDSREKSKNGMPSGWRSWFDFIRKRNPPVAAPSSRRKFCVPTIVISPPEETKLGDVVLKPKPDRKGFGVERISKHSKRGHSAQLLSNQRSSGVAVTHRTLHFARDSADEALANRRRLSFPNNHTVSTRTVVKGLDFNDLGSFGDPAVEEDVGFARQNYSYHGSASSSQSSTSTSSPPRKSFFDLSIQRMKP